MNQLAHWIKDFDEHNTFMDKNMAGLTGNFGIGCVTCRAGAASSAPSALSASMSSCSLAARKRSASLTQSTVLPLPLGGLDQQPIGAGSGVKLLEQLPLLLGQPFDPAPGPRCAR